MFSNFIEKNLSSSLDFYSLLYFRVLSIVLYLISRKRRESRI